MFWIQAKRKSDDLEMRLHTMHGKDCLDFDSAMDGYKDDDESPTSSMKLDPVSPADSSMSKNHEGDSSTDVCYLISPTFNFTEFILI